MIIGKPWSELAGDQLTETNCWQDNDGRAQDKRGWVDFEANKEGFPRGMKHTVAQIREKHPNIQHIAVWHALVSCGV